MNKYEIRLEQNKADQQRLKAEQLRLERELEESKKPELRHGDYNRKGILYLKQCGTKTSQVDMIGTDSHCFPDSPFNDSASSFDVEEVVGNFYDDMKRNSEDLHTFDLTVSGGSQFSFKVHGGDFIQFVAKAPYSSTTTFVTASLKDAIIIHQRLGQMIATQQRSS